jgi:hypothetical protein
LKKTREDLINQASSKSFVDIRIKPPNFDAEQEYTSLREQYPVEGIIDYSQR